MGQGVRPRLNLEANSALLALRGHLSQHAGSSLSVNETVLLASSLVMSMPGSALKREAAVWKQNRRGPRVTVPG